MSSRRNVWFLCIFALGYLVSAFDYVSRTHEDLDRSIEVCGDLIDVSYSSTGIRGSGGLIINLNKSVSPNTFRATRHTINLEKLLSPYAGKSICVRYVKSPLLTFLRYPIEVYDKDGIIISSDKLLPQYLDRAGEYLFWFAILTAYLFFILYKRRKK